MRRTQRTRRVSPLLALRLVMGVITDHAKDAIVSFPPAHSREASPPVAKIFRLRSFSRACGPSSEGCSLVQGDASLRRRRIQSLAQSELRTGERCIGQAIALLLARRRYERGLIRVPVDGEAHRGCSVHTGWRAAVRDWRSVHPSPSTELECTSSEP